MANLATWQDVYREIADVSAKLDQLANQMARLRARVPWSSRAVGEQAPTAPVVLESRDE
jgi:hypothetical protein